MKAVKNGLCERQITSFKYKEVESNILLDLDPTPFSDPNIPVVLPGGNELSFSHRCGEAGSSATSAEIYCISALNFEDLGDDQTINLAIKGDAPES